MRKPSLSRSGRLTRRIPAGAVALAVIALLGLPAVGHADDAPSPACPGPAPSADFPCVAALSYLNANGGEVSPLPILLVDQGLRRLVATGFGSDYYQLEIDTPTGVPRQLSRTPVGSLVSASALDSEQHRLFLIVASDLMGIDGLSHAIAVRSLTDSFAAPANFDLTAEGGPELAGQQPYALAYDAPHKILYVQSGGASGVSALDASAPDGKLTFKWNYRTPGCLLPLGDHAFLGVADSGKLLYFGCKGNSIPDANQTNPPHMAMVVNMGSPAPAGTGEFVTEDYPFAGDLTYGESWGDPAGERLLISAGGAGLQKLFIFDARHRAWVGSRPLGSSANVLGTTADPSTGRIYPVQSTKLTYLINGGQLPTSQGKPVSLGVIVNGTAFQQTAFDPVTRRLFISGGFTGDNCSPGTSGSSICKEALRVYQDNTPPALPTPKPDPDTATHDISESNAVNVKASGEGSAFGTRAAFVGGFHQSTVGGWTDNLGSNGPQPGNRNLFAAQVSLAQLGGDASSGGSAKAEAQGAGLDKATGDDFRSRGFPYDSFMSGTGEFVPSRCSDFGNEGDAKSQTNVGSATTCRAGQNVAASASATGPIDLSPIKAAYSHSEVTVQRDPVLGMVVTSTAVAKGIDIAGGLHIGEVRSTAVSRAHGRPGTAKSTYSSSINQVRIADPTTGETKFACGWAPERTEGTDDPNGRCDPTAVARAIDQFYGFIVHAEAGRRDKEKSVFNSPGGAQASVTKDPYSYWNDFNINSDGGREVYGLQLTIYDDNSQASDLVIQLAGVRTQAGYTVGALNSAPEPDATTSSGATASGDDPRPFNPLVQDSAQVTYIQQVSNTRPAALTIQNLAKVVRRIFHQAAQGVRFLVRHPAEAGLFGMVWALMGAPAYLGRRRFLGSLVARAAAL